jgi:hypothetical protein
MNFNPFVKRQKSYRGLGRSRNLTQLEGQKKFDSIEYQEIQADNNLTTDSYTIEDLQKNPEKERLLWVNKENLNKTAIADEDINTWLGSEGVYELTASHRDSDCTMFGNVTLTRYEAQSGKLYGKIYIHEALESISTFQDLKKQLEVAREEGYDARVGFSPSIIAKKDEEGKITDAMLQNVTLTPQPSAVQTLGNKNENVDGQNENKIKNLKETHKQLQENYQKIQDEKEEFKQQQIILEEMVNGLIKDQKLKENQILKQQKETQKLRETAKNQLKQQKEFIDVIKEQTKTIQKLKENVKSFDSLTKEALYKSII